MEVSAPGSPDREVSIPEALRRCMQQAPLPFAVTRGADHELAYANAAFFRLAVNAGLSGLGKPIATAFTPARNAALQQILDRAFREGVELCDERIPGPGERESDWECSVWPVMTDDGSAEALGIEIRDSTARDSALELQRQVAEQMLLGALRERGLAEDAEAARRRAAFLAEASRLLAGSVDQTCTLVTLTKLALPTIGAWCVVDIVEEDDAIRRLGIYHPDPEKQTLALAMDATWGPKANDQFGASAMMRDPHTIAITSDLDSVLASTGNSAGNLRILRELGTGSLLTVPLISRQRLLGAMTFVCADAGASYSPLEVQLAEDIAARGALALDNAQVYDLAVKLKLSAEEANSAKTAFLGAMSHELRTPLNAIGGYIDLLDMGLRGPVTEAQRADFARVRTSQQHLTLLITEILNFVRIGKDNVSYAVNDINVHAAIEHAIELVEPLFAKKELTFKGITCDREVVARADADKVTQILVNLLSNAIKFTPAGGEISAECAVARDSVNLTVSDTGIGISADKLETMFEPFVQLKEGLAHREGGVGLGLAISRDLARAMKGDLTVESSEGKGSRLTLSLPRGGDDRKV